MDDGAPQSGGGKKAQLVDSGSAPYDGAAIDGAPSGQSAAAVIRVLSSEYPNKGVRHERDDGQFREVVLAGAGRPEQEHVLALGDEARSGELVDQRATA
jgi:hypothetical protein